MPRIDQIMGSGAVGVGVALLSLSANAWFPREVADIDVGPQHSCLLTTCGETDCWSGASAYGEDYDNWNLVADIAVGTDHSCALSYSGIPWCWGANFYGQTSTPYPLVELSEIDSYGHHTCGLRESDDRAVCWGWDAYGQVSAKPDRRFKQISAATYHTCGVTIAGGGIYCWGYTPSNVEHALGSDMLLEYGSGERFVEVATGSFHNCARSTRNRLYCWGDDSFGAVLNMEVDPDFVTTQSVTSASGDSVPVFAHYDDTYLDVSAGHIGTCTIGVDAFSQKLIRCFGWPYDNGGVFTPPAAHAGFHPDRVSAGFQHACAWDEDFNTTECWGEDNAWYSSAANPITANPYVGGVCLPQVIEPTLPPGPLFP